MQHRRVKKRYFKSYVIRLKPKKAVHQVLQAQTWNLQK